MERRYEAKSHNKNHRSVLISKKQTSNSIRGYHNRNLYLHTEYYTFHYFQNHESIRMEKGQEEYEKGSKRYPLFQRYVAMVEVNRASFIGYVEGRFLFLSPSPSSWPCRHPFHRLDVVGQSSSSSTIRRFPLDLTARQKFRLSFPLLATANVSGNHRFHFTSSILPSASPLILDFLCIPVLRFLRSPSKEGEKSQTYG